MALINYFSKKDVHGPTFPFIWEMMIFLCVAGGLFLLGVVASDMFVAYEVGDLIEIDLNPWRLPYYAFRTILRMFIALFFSFICAFVFGSLAAKSPWWEKIIIPAVDIMQAIPVIGFLEVAFLSVLYAFKGSFLGPEIISIIAVFVSQVWNLVLSYYESLKLLPKELDEVARIYRFPPMERFLRLEIPFAAPGLIWNAMLSLSAGWFFVVAGEAITIANHSIALPGIGSYIAQATQVGNSLAIYYAIGCLFVVIMLYDQLIFRPLNYWLAARNSTEYSSNWVHTLLARSRVLALSVSVFKGLFLRVGRVMPRRAPISRVRYYQPLGSIAGVFVLGYLLYVSQEALVDFVVITEWKDVSVALYSGGLTALRVFTLVIICCIIWVPIGIFLGLSDKVASVLQPVIQFLAAFPPNMLYPFVGSMVIAKGYNPNIWLSPLIVLGTQWYILFNVIAGVRSLPKDYLLMAKSLGLGRWQLYKKVILPGILPSLLTGVITAVGGAWNTSIIAEVAEWHGQVVYSDGLGAYIMYASRHANTHLVYLGVVIMCLYVFVINRILWVPLYQYVERRYGRGKCQGQY